MLKIVTEQHKNALKHGFKPFGALHFGKRDFSALFKSAYKVLAKITDIKKGLSQNDLTP